MYDVSFEVGLKKMLRKGATFCDKCWTQLTNHFDDHKLMHDDAEMDQPAVSRQKSPALQVQQLRSLSYTYKVEKREPAPPKEGRLPVPIPPVQLPQTGIFEDSKFIKLCELLEKSMGSIGHMQSQNLNSHILADKIRELTQDLRVSQHDLKEHQLVIRSLCQKNHKLRQELGRATIDLNTLRAKDRNAQVVADQLNSMRSAFLKLTKKIEAVKASLLQYSSMIGEDIERAAKNDALQTARSSQMREQLDQIFRHFREVSWEKIAGDIKNIDPDNYFGIARLKQMSASKST